MGDQRGKAPFLSRHLRCSFDGERVTSHDASCEYAEENEAPRIERVFEPSHIRRGRLATSPTWFVNAPDGVRWRFMRKKDAVAFLDSGALAGSPFNGYRVSR